MGTLTDAGIIIDGKVPDESFAAYVNDVIKMLQSGNGIFPQGVICNKEVKPNPAAKDLDLNNKKSFPDFHRIWRPRFEKMVLALDTPGDFQLAKNGLIPLIDPTALATFLGAKPANLTIPEILLQMTTGLPPLMVPGPGPVAYFALNLDPSAFSPADAPGMLLKILDAIKPIPPLPPIPSLPNPILLKFGYTEQFNFDLALALAPMTTHLKLMMPALLLENMPGLFAKLAQGDIIGSFVKFMCDQISADQPKSMSTSDIEIAAQQILQQYQVKYQTISFVGQLIGSGATTKALAQESTPVNPFGLSVIKKPSTETVEFISTGTGGAVGSLRAEISALIVSVIGPYDLNKEVSINASQGGLGAEDKEIPLELIPAADQRTKTAEQQTADADLEANQASGVVPETQPVFELSEDDKKSDALEQIASDKLTAKIEANKPRMSTQDMANEVALHTEPDGKLSTNAPEWMRKISPAALKDLPNRAKGETSCGKFIGNIFQLWFQKNLIQSGENGGMKKYKNPDKNWEADVGKENRYGLANNITLANGGLNAYMGIGLAIEALSTPPSINRVWVCVDPRVAGTPSVVDARVYPEKGDVIMEFSAAIAGTTPDEIRKFRNLAADYVGFDHPDLTTAIQVENQNKKNPGRRPWRAGAIEHVCFFIQRETRGDNREIWITVDGGQGTALNQTTKWKRKQIERDEKKGLRILNIDINDDVTVPFANDPQKRASIRYVGGWLNLDAIPELIRAEGSKSHIDVAKNNANIAARVEKAAPPNP